MRGRRVRFPRLLALGLLATPGLGAERARGGGVLSVGLVSVESPHSDSVPETPEAWSARAPLALPLCRLLPAPVPLLTTLQRAGTDAEPEVQVAVVPGARFADGTNLRPGDIADSWRRLLLARSPYASLLAPVAHLEETLAEAAQHRDAPLRLRLLHPWPDLEASLCHPAFTPTRAGAHPGQGVGLYAATKEGRFNALPQAPGGAPFPAALSLATLPARSAERLLQRGEVQVVLGNGSKTDSTPLLFATYLVYDNLPREAAVMLERMDFTALVRTFVPGPAVAFKGLLPPALGESPVASSKWLPGTSCEAPCDGNLEVEACPLPPPPPASKPPAFRLGYDVGVPEQRAVAERLQVILHDGGYSVRLVPDTATNITRARASGGVLDAALVSILLPPRPAAALAVVLGLDAPRFGGRLVKELPLLGAVAEDEARAKRARTRGGEIACALNFIPIYVRGLRVQLSDAVVDARRDAFGLLVLDDAWLVR